MANTNGPFGFRPVRRLDGGGDIRTTEYSIASTYNTAIYTGDPVQMTGTGRNIELSEAGNVDNIGVFAGVRFVNAAGEQKFSKFWTAGTTGTDIVALVWDDPNIVFECQFDTLAAGDIGELTDWNAGTGSAATGQSGAYCEAAGATSGESMRILRLVNRPDNEYGAYAKAEVCFIEHVLKGVIAGVGGV
jgi:hypothetical protein